MKNVKLKCLIGILLITSIIFMLSLNTLYAATNKIYGEPASVHDENLDDKVESGGLIEMLAKAVYYVAGWIENAVGGAFKMLTGRNEFPWADRVIFNSVSFLDINFLNPSSGSLFLTSDGSDTALAKVIKNIYGSIMSLTIGLLGVVVAIMSIKLALSTIASEKAKYKQAIAKFAMSLIMVFCVHYIISLVFYVNEKLVELASSMLLQTISEQELSNDLDLSKSLNGDTIVDIFLQNNAPSGSTDNWWTAVSGNGKEDIISLALIDDFNRQIPGKDGLRENIKNYLCNLSIFDSYSSISKYISDNEKVASTLLSNEALKETRYGVANSGDTSKGDDAKKGLIYLAVDIWLATGGEGGDTPSSGATSYIKDFNEYIKEALDVFNSYNKMSELAQQYFDGSKKFKDTDLYKICVRYGVKHDGSDYKPRLIWTSDASEYLSEGAYEVYTDTYYPIVFYEKGLDFSEFLGAFWEAGNHTFTRKPYKTSKNYTVSEDKTFEFTKIIVKMINDSKDKNRAYFNALDRLYEAYVNEDPSKMYSNEPVAIISSLSNYFKDSVWTYEVDENGDVIGWRTSNFTVSGAIIYAIFIVQSLMFFFAYIKRFFYKYSTSCYKWYL